MKKIEEKRLITEEWAEGDFKYRGCKIAFRKYWIPIVLFVIASLIGISYASNIPDKTIGNMVALISAVLLIALFALFYFETGNQYWEKVKNMKQPIKLEEYPSLWWLFTRK